LPLFAFSRAAIATRFLHRLAWLIESADYDNTPARLHAILITLHSFQFTPIAAAPAFRLRRCFRFWLSLYAGADNMKAAFAEALWLSAPAEAAITPPPPTFSSGHYASASSIAFHCHFRFPATPPAITFIIASRRHFLSAAHFSSIIFTLRHFDRAMAIRRQPLIADSRCLIFSLPLRFTLSAASATDEYFSLISRFD
jgi:hypothetical protein